MVVPTRLASSTRRRWAPAGGATGACAAATLIASFLPATPSLPRVPVRQRVVDRVRRRLATRPFQVVVHPLHQPQRVVVARGSAGVALALAGIPHNPHLLLPGLTEDEV